MTHVTFRILPVIFAAIVSIWLRTSNPPTLWKRKNPCLELRSAGAGDVTRSWTRVKIDLTAAVRTRVTIINIIQARLHFSLEFWTFINRIFFFIPKGSSTPGAPGKYTTVHVRYVLCDVRRSILTERNIFWCTVDTRAVESFTAFRLLTDYFQRNIRKFGSIYILIRAASIQ